MIIISERVLKELVSACERKDSFSNPALRRNLQATYETLLDELSHSIFGKPCINRPQLRLELNRLSSSEVTIHGERIVEALRETLRNENLLYNKSYSDRTPDTERFLSNHLCILIEEIINGQ